MRRYLSSFLYIIAGLLVLSLAFDYYSLFESSGAKASIPFSKGEVESVEKFLIVAVGLALVVYGFLNWYIHGPSTDE